MKNMNYVSFCKKKQTVNSALNLLKHHNCCMNVVAWNMHDLILV